LFANSIPLPDGDIEYTAVYTHNDTESEYEIDVEKGNISIEYYRGRRRTTDNLTGADTNSDFGKEFEVELHNRSRWKYDTFHEELFKINASGEVRPEDKSGDEYIVKYDISDELAAEFFDKQFTTYTGRKPLNLTAEDIDTAEAELTFITYEVNGTEKVSKSRVNPVRLTVEARSVDSNRSLHATSKLVTPSETVLSS